MMKFNEQKLVIIILICLIPLFGVFVLYPKPQKTVQDVVQINPYTNTNNTKTTNVIKSEYKADIDSNYLKEEGITDVFYGSINSSKVKEDSSVLEPGVRINVSIITNRNYHNIGNAKGTVVVNNSTGKYLKALGSPLLYRFFTKYDAKNNWYTTIKIVAPPPEPDL